MPRLDELVYSAWNLGIFHPRPLCAVSHVIQVFSFLGALFAFSDFTFAFAFSDLTFAFAFAAASPPAPALATASSFNPNSSLTRGAESLSPL